MTLAEVAARVEAAGFPIKWERNNSSFKTRCPCHDERTPSCTIKQGDSGIVGFCFGCGAKGEAIANALGMDIKEWFSQPYASGNGYKNGNSKVHHAPPPKQIESKPLQNPKETKYRVLNPEGTLIATHMRLDGIDPDTGKPAKRMWWEPAGVRTKDLPLYCSQLLKNYPDDEYPIVTEGEKACMALRARGLPAVGTVCGAAAVPGDEALSPLLRFSSVTLWPDNDDVGRTHMERTAAALARLGHKSIFVLDVSRFNKGDDAADLPVDFNVNEFLESAKQWSPASTIPAISGDKTDLPALVVPWETRTLAEVANEAYLQRTAIVDQLFYSSAVSMITGGKHAGKSTLTRYLAICVAQGKQFLGREVIQGPVYYIASSDETMSARMELLRLGWKPDDQLRFVSSAVIADALGDLPAFFAALAEELRQAGAVLLVLDMLFDFMQVRDEMGYADTRKGVGEIERVAALSGTHIAVVHHAPKHAAYNAEAAVTALGSQGLAARVSPIVLVRRHGPGVHSVVSTDVRDPRGKAIAQSRLTLESSGMMKLGGEWKDWMQAEVYKPQILDVLAAEEGQEMTANQLADALETTYRTVAAACSQLYKSGEIGRVGSGRKGSPYRYALYAQAPSSSKTSNDPIADGVSNISNPDQEFSHPQKSFAELDTLMDSDNSDDTEEFN